MGCAVLGRNVALALMHANLDKNATSRRRRARKDGRKNERGFALRLGRVQRSGTRKAGTVHMPSPDVPERASSVDTRDA